MTPTNRSIKKVKGKVKYIDYGTAADFLLLRHYSGRIPVISYAFGWYVDNELAAVCTFGKPASNSLCTGICGKEYAGRVFELNRLCRLEYLKEPLSYFVSACLRRLSGDNLIIVSYSDTAMGHHGYLYQACNFLYTGATKPRTDKYTLGGKHARHYNKNNANQLKIFSVIDDGNELRVLRSSKHRYVFFAMKDKKLKKKARSAMAYSVEPYPKGDNDTYELGNYLKPVVISKSEPNKPLD